jgi:hypothetical protein
VSARSTPPFGGIRPNTYSQWNWRLVSNSFMPSMVWAICFVMDSGRYTCGRTPSVVPSKPRGATPTTVTGCPSIIMVRFSTPGSAPSCDCQYP